MSVENFKRLYKKIWKKIPKMIRRVINILDNPFDRFKEYLYNDGKGRAVWKYRLYFNCIMMNKKGGCKIEKIR